LLSIGELAGRTGVPATTLRYYDELGLVRPAARAAGDGVIPSPRSRTSV
jgi:DNA-binding transcriptional MerR regulator